MPQKIFGSEKDLTVPIVGSNVIPVVDGQGLHVEAMVLKRAANSLARS